MQAALVKSSSEHIAHVSALQVDRPLTHMPMCRPMLLLNDVLQLSVALRAGTQELFALQIELDAEKQRALSSSPNCMMRRRSASHHVPCMYNVLTTGLTQLTAASLFCSCIKSHGKLHLLAHHQIVAAVLSDLEIRCQACIWADSMFAYSQAGRYAWCFAASFLFLSVCLHAYPAHPTVLR